MNKERKIIHDIWHPGVGNYDEYTLRDMQNLYTNALETYKKAFKKTLDDGAQVTDMKLVIEFEGSSYGGVDNESKFYIFRTESDGEYNYRIAEEKRIEKIRKEAEDKKKKDEEKIAKLKADPDYEKYIKLSKKFKDIK